MSPIDHLIVTVLGSRRAQARKRPPTPAPAAGKPGRCPPEPPADRRPAASGGT